MLIAVIVTYNRLDQLRIALNALFKSQYQPDRVIVVNNCSTDLTSSWLLEQQDILPSLLVVNLGQNLGGAGGFNVGIKTAYELGADYVWVSDDDAYVHVDSLGALIRANDMLHKQQVISGFLCSKIIWRDGNSCYLNQPVVSDDWLDGNNISSSLIKLQSCSFVSCLVSRTAIERVGFPIADFFIWYDDTEYTQRISNQFPSYLVLDSVVRHDCPENQKFSLSAINAMNSWKYYYGARNSAWVVYHNKGVVAWCVFILRQLKVMHQEQVSLKYSWGLIRSYLKALLFKPKIEASK